MADEDPQTGQMRAIQREREQVERQHAEEAPTPEDTQTHQRRADRAEYLKEKLRERGEAEAEAGEDG
jgi:hypothetical protein